ncbi:hypothetical protein ABBQ38_006682 [Trebouxia sp. C0009 RCD-2024]
MLYRRVASPLHERDLSADLDAVASSADEKDGSSVDEHKIEISEDDASVGENAMQDSPVRGVQDPDYSPAPDSVRRAMAEMGLQGPSPAAAPAVDTIDVTLSDNEPCTSDAPDSISPAAPSGSVEHNHIVRAAAAAAAGGEDVAENSLACLSAVVQP